MKPYVIQNFKSNLGEVASAKWVTPGNKIGRSVRISGKDISILPEAGVAYKCEALTSLTLTGFPESGSFFVVFTSGTPATVMSVPNTLHMPEEFSVEENTRYEINVRDGFALCAGWPVPEEQEAEGEHISGLADRRRALLGAQKDSRLPSEYQQVEWIGSSGSGGPYFVTNYTPQYTDKLFFAFTRDSGTGYQHPVSAGSKNCESMLQITNKEIFWKWFSSGYVSSGRAASYGTRYDCIADAGELSGMEGGAMNPPNISGNAVDSPLYIMTRKNGLSQLLIGKIYYVKAERNGKLVFNAVPCYRKADSVAGLFDTVTKTFFVNAGSGTVTKGADV